MSDDLDLARKRERAEEFNPRLAAVIEASGDLALLEYVQEVVDRYMMHECKLGRVPDRLTPPELGGRS